MNSQAPGTPSIMRTLLAWLPAALYTSLIWWLSSQSKPIQNLDQFPFQDKGAHLVEYTGLGLCLCFAVYRTWPRRGLRAAAAAILMTVGLGLLDEFHQAFVPLRSADVFDLLADTAGATVAALCFELLARLRRPTKPDPHSNEANTAGESPSP